MTSKADPRAVRLEKCSPFRSHISLLDVTVFMINQLEDSAFYLRFYDLYVLS